MIPQPADQAANRQRLGRLGGRPSAFDRDAYITGLRLAAIFIWSAR
ncbi:hypothetical protein ACFQ0X_01375 [Streptomyces rectiviolaceus]